MIFILVEMYVKVCKLVRLYLFFDLLYLIVIKKEIIVGGIVEGWVGYILFEGD